LRRRRHLLCASLSCRCGQYTPLGGGSAAASTRGASCT
jgi:hypothetical protein